MDSPKAFLVLGGEGWTLRAFYTEGGLASDLVAADKVSILTLEHFVASAKQGDSESRPSIREMRNERGALTGA